MQDEREEKLDRSHLKPVFREKIKALKDLFFRPCL